MGVRDIINQKIMEELYVASACMKAMGDVESRLVKGSWESVEKNPPYIVAKNGKGTKLILVPLFLSEWESERVATEGMYKLTGCLMSVLPEIGEHTYLGVVTNSDEFEETLQETPYLLPIGQSLSAKGVSLKFFVYDMEEGRFFDSSVYDFIASVERQ